MTVEAIKIDKLSITLDKHTQALTNVSLNLAQGKIIGFIGPSGAGKTTLIRGIVGRQRLTSGTITIFGLPAGSAQLRQHISYMTQEVSVYGDLSVMDNLVYFATVFGVPSSRTKSLSREILDVVDLSPRSDQLVERLSGGQKQRVSLAIALIGSPKLMVLDEPTVGLDPVLREQLWKLFRKLAASGTTLIISSHVMDEAEHCDDLVLIREGELIAHGSPADLCAQTKSKTVEHAFIKLVGGKS